MNGYLTNPIDDGKILVTDPHCGQRMISLKQRVAGWVKWQVKIGQSPDDDDTGIIYFLSAGGTKLWKVGFSGSVSQLNRRVGNIQTGCPHEIRLRAAMPHCPHRREAELHELMDWFHVRGEWFYYNEWIRQIVKQWPHK